MQYETEIDEQTWAFIRKAESFYSDDMTEPTVEQQRQEYDRMCRAFFVDYPKELNIETSQWDGIPVRIYQPTKPIGTLVYYHGGGFVVGGLESHDDVCAELAYQSGLRVISVAYRLAPEHKHPAQFDDAMHALQIASNRYPAPLIVAGDSAGGNIAAAISHHARKTDMQLAGQILVYPTLATQMVTGSYIEHANAPLLTCEDMIFYRDVRCKNDAPTNDPTFAPLDDTDFAALPPTVIFTAACDPLADDGKNYRDAIIAAGGKAHWVNEAGLVHMYLRARTTVARAKDSFERIVASTVILAKGEWPY